MEYYSNSGSTVDISALTAAADAAKLQAETSMELLKELKPELVCETGNAAGDVSAFKEGVEQARQDLNAYRVSVKNILKTLIDDGDEQ